MIDLIQKIWDILNRIMRWFVYDLFRLKISEENWNKFLQFVKFGIVGVSNTLISYIIYVVSLMFFERNGLLPDFDYIVAQVIAFFISVLWSFYWNRKFVFEAENEVSWPKALLKTYISYAFTGIFLSNVLLILWVQILHISKLIAPIINLLVSVPLNFILNKFWAFRKDEGK